MHVSDDDGFVRPRTGGSHVWKNLVTFESTSGYYWFSGSGVVSVS